jgi:hypothetical protein
MPFRASFSSSLPLAPVRPPEKKVADVMSGTPSRAALICFWVSLVGCVGGLVRRPTVRRIRTPITPGMLSASAELGPDPPNCPEHPPRGGARVRWSA